MPKTNSYPNIARAVAAAALLLCGVTEATPFRYGVHAWTPVSGYSGFVDELLASAYHGIHHLRFYDGVESGANSIRVYTHALSTDAEQEEEIGVVGIGRLDDPSIKDLDVGNDRVITAIRVCTNETGDTNDRHLKGAEVWSARVKIDGTLEPTTAPASLKFERTSCKHWENKVSCGTNQVATGIRSYGDRSGLRGLALRCTKLLAG